MSAYTLRYAPEVKRFFQTLCPDDQAEIRALLDTIRHLPEHGQPVQSIPGVQYMKSYSLDKTRWPHGLRVFYTVFQDICTIAIIDLGDHTTSARRQGESVYPDEQRAKVA